MFNDCKEKKNNSINFNDNIKEEQITVSLISHELVIKALTIKLQKKLLFLSILLQTKILAIMSDTAGYVIFKGTVSSYACS